MMTRLTKIIYSIVLTILFVVAFQTICNFFDIGFEPYGNFLLWSVALIVFFALLPSRPYAFDVGQKSMF